MTGITRGRDADIDVLECLSARRRRAVVSVLRAEDGGIPMDELAARVAARAADEPGDVGDQREPGDVGDERIRRVRVALHHRDVPKLVDVGLAARDGDAVEPRDHPLLADPNVQRALNDPDDHDRLNEMFEALADERRQRVLGVLTDLEHALEPREIAVLVAARERDCSPQTVPVGFVDRVHTAVYHVHLPMLADAGLVARDGDGTFTDDATDLPVTWPAGQVERSGLEAR